MEIKHIDSLDMRSHIKLQGVASKETLKKNERKVKRVASEVDFENLILTGAGDKLVVPYIASFLFKAYGKKPVEVIHSRTLADYLPSYINEKTLAILVSQSGKTKDTIDSARVLAKKGAKMIVLTNLKEKEENSLWFVEDYGGVVLNTFTPIYPEKALPSTLTFHSSLILLFYLLSELSGLEVYKELENLAEKVDELSKDEKIEEWGMIKAQELVRFCGEVKYVMGDGPRYGIARKIALIMLMEGAKENACAIETEEFLHSLIETLEEENPRKKPLIMFLPPKDSPLRNLSEKIARIWKKYEYTLEIEPERVCEDPLLNDIFSVQLQVIPAEWLCYYLAILKGTDPGVSKLVKKVRSGKLL